MRHFEFECKQATGVCLVALRVRAELNHKTEISLVELITEMTEMSLFVVICEFGSIFLETKWRAWKVHHNYGNQKITWRFSYEYTNLFSKVHIFLIKEIAGEWSAAFQHQIIIRPTDNRTTCNGLSTHTWVTIKCELYSLAFIWL